MKARSVVLRLGTFFAAFIAVASAAHADDFIEACKAGNREGTDMTQTCNCISGSCRPPPGPTPRQRCAR
jgi:hypothetical protein